MIKQRPLRNPAEEAFRQAAEANGWEVTKRGWPDFFCMKDGELACVEVKPSEAKALKDSQVLVMKTLARYGVPCYRWTPEGGFRRVYDEGPF